MVYTWKALLSPSKPTYPAEMIHTAWGITSTRPYLRATNSWPQWTPAESMSEAVESISTSADNLLPLAHILHWQRRKEETEERYASLDFRKNSTCGVLICSPAPDPVPAAPISAAPASVSGPVTFTAGQEELKVPPFVPVLQKPVRLPGFLFTISLIWHTV